MKKVLLGAILLFSSFGFSQVPNNVPTDGLVGFYGFNGNANDLSVNANNGTVYGATLTADRFGNQNSAYDFDGKTNHISLNNKICNFGTSDFTMSAWVLKYDSKGDGSVIGKRNSGGQGNMVILASNPGYELCTSLDTQDYKANNINYNVTNIWYHILVIRSANNIKFYLNGILFDNYNSPTIHDINNSAITEIGAWYNDTQVWALWHGKIDDVAIFNRALTQTEVSNLYNPNQTLGNEEFNKSTVTVYPNPTTDFLNFNTDSEVNVKIFDLLGKLVINQNVTKQISLSELNKGLYLVEVSNNDIQYKTKIIKN